ncbi:hypothetical protein BMS3Abin09_00558 [bacterium BMS3Abin09]|nr:hypothetical protein BMS3Abin09_00558 [bacterium BMS3Abin09]GBE41667.1 hypothetical protein BMS3Bbin09_01574 [bacterium BMS3Bbin09]
MRILLIGNFAPPYEEENLHNLSLLDRLENDGHKCTVLNISGNPASNKKIINSKSFLNFVRKLLHHSRKKDVVHFLTKGYLRVGLLKLMASIFAGKLFRLKTVITFHSELFSILGQMRSPFGGTQTLNTSFFFADKIIYNDRDTYEVASMYRKKSNFELIPSFVHMPQEKKEKKENVSRNLKKLQDKDKVIMFTNVKYPSYVFNILMSLINDNPFPPGTGIVISFSEKQASKFNRIIEETGGKLSEDMIFVENDDLQSTLVAFSKADIIIRPLSCDGETFFERFSASAAKTFRSNNNIYFPGGLVFVKKGRTADMCLNIINTMLSTEPADIPELNAGDPYTRIKQIYEK